MIEIPIAILVLIAGMMFALGLLAAPLPGYANSRNRVERKLDRAPAKWEIAIGNERKTGDLIAEVRLVRRHKSAVRIERTVSVARLDAREVSAEKILSMSDEAERVRLALTMTEYDK